MAEGLFNVRFVDKHGNVGQVQQWERSKLFEIRDKAGNGDYSVMPDNVRTIEYQPIGGTGWQGFGPGPISAGEA